MQEHADELLLRASRVVAASLGDTASPISQEETRTAPPPFDKPFADLILRSSDDVDFQVFKWILSDASDVFAGMFSLPPASSVGSDVSTRSDDMRRSSQIPVVPVTEDSNTLEALLRLCYPLCIVPDYDSFDDIKPVVAAAHKYQLDHALRILEPRMKFFAAQHPVRVYAFATRYNLPEVVQEAAQNFLFTPDTLATEVTRKCHVVRCATEWFGKFYCDLIDILGATSLVIPESEASQLIHTTLQAAAPCSLCHDPSLEAQLRAFLAFIKDDVKRRAAAVSLVIA